MKKKEKKEDEFEGFDDSENQFGSEENTAPDDDDEKRIELPRVVELQDPFTLGKKKYAEFTFQNNLEIEMLQHFVVGGEGSQKIGHFIGPIAKMTGEPTAAVKKLSWRDFDACMSVVLSFF